MKARALNREALNIHLTSRPCLLLTVHFVSLIWPSGAGLLINLRVASPDRCLIKQPNLKKKYLNKTLLSIINAESRLMK